MSRMFAANESEGDSAGSPAAKPTPPTAAVNSQQKLVVSGAVELTTDDVRGTAAAIRADAISRGAVIVSDRETGARYGVNAEMQLRIPPAAVDPFLAWLATKGAIESTNLSASDVSRQYVDQELRLRTLRFTLGRLEKLLAERTNVPLADVLSVEREMTRVRGEIELLEGQHRYLADRAERATLDVHISGRDQIAPGAPEQKFILMARGLGLRFADEGFRHQGRLGAGLALMFGRRFDIGLDVFPSRGLDDRSITLNMGAAVYSDFLGGGRRRYGNPFVGLRVGAGGINNRSTLTFGGEVGVELVRLPSLLIELTGRAVGLYYNRNPSGSDITFQAVLGAGVPF